MFNPTEQEFCQKCNDIDIDKEKGNWIGMAIIFAIVGFIAGVVMVKIGWL